MRRLAITGILVFSSLSMAVELVLSASTTRELTSSGYSSVSSPGYGWTSSTHKQAYLNWSLSSIPVGSRIDLVTYDIRADGASDFAFINVVETSSTPTSLVSFGDMGSSVASLLAAGPTQITTANGVSTALKNKIQQDLDGTGTFRGVVVNNVFPENDVSPGVYKTELRIDYTIGGDADGDGDVDFVDFLALARNYGTSGNLWSEGDFTGDTWVNFTDYLILQMNFTTGQQNAPPAP